jgi:hypothetical protein
MANISYLSTPGTHAVIFSRVVIFALSTTALALFATTLHIYNTQVAPAGTQPRLNDSLLITNAVPFIPLAFSIAWSVTQLALLARRVRRAHRRNRRGLGAADAEKEARDRGRPLVHPGWDVGIDCLCGVLLVVAAALTGVEVGKWRIGELDDGSGGTVHVNLKTCPSFDPTTGVLDYWCGDAWNQLVNLTFDGMNIMGPLAYVLVP